MRVPEAAAFHQLDVDAVKHAHGTADIIQSLDGLVAEDGQLAAFPEPGQVVDAVDGHRLLHHHDAMVPEPVDHVQGLEAVGPALVRIDGDREVRDGTDGLDEFLVVGRTYLDFQDVEAVRTFLRLFLDHLGRVDADGEGRGRCLGGVVAPNPVPWGAEQFAHQVVEGDVHGGLRGTVARRKAVHIGEDVLQAERIRELFEVHFFQEGGHRVDTLAQVGRHRGFAVACIALVFDFHLHVRCGCAAVGGDGEGMLELEFVRVIAEFHPAGADDDGLDRLQGVSAGRNVRSRHPALLAADRQAGADGGQAGHFQEFTSVLHGFLFQIIGVCHSGVQAFLLVYERQDPAGKQIPAGIVGIVFRILRTETADFHEAKRVDELAVAQVEAHVGDLGRSRVLAAEEDKVARLEIL